MAIDKPKGFHEERLRYLENLVDSLREQLDKVEQQPAKVSHQKEDDDLHSLIERTFEDAASRILRHPIFR